jgi:hypothetical protein
MCLPETGAGRAPVPVPTKSFPTALHTGKREARQRFHRGEIKVSHKQERGKTEVSLRGDKGFTQARERVSLRGDAYRGGGGSEGAHGRRGLTERSAG